MRPKHYTPKKGPAPNLADHQPKERKCLGCEKLFWSLGPANRFCKPCAKKASEAKEGGRRVQDTRGQ